MRAFLTSESLPAMGEDSPGRTKKMGSLRQYYHVHIMTPFKAAHSKFGIASFLTDDFPKEWC